LIILIDASVAVASFWLAMLIRFEGQITDAYWALMPQFIVLVAVSRVVANYLFRLHRWSFRLSGLSDALRVGISGLLGTGLFMTLVFMLRVGDFRLDMHGQKWGPPRSVVVLDFFIATTAMGMMRFSPRLAWSYAAGWQRSQAPGGRRAIIYGAGAAGDALLRDLERSNEHQYQAIAFVDDDSSKWGMIIGGKPVLGGGTDLPGIVRRFRADTVLIAIPRLPAQRLREILSLCSELQLRFKILPLSILYLSDHQPLAMLQDLSPEHLLPRESVEFVHGAIGGKVRGKTALVTGAAGSIGQEICRQLLQSGISEIVMLDINENDLYLTSRRFSRSHPDGTVIPHVGDIKDMVRIRELFAAHRPHHVFHAAAHKHVPLMEAAPCEAVKNNVLGTLNVVNAAIEHKVERFVFISTDKAVRPTSIMGATKRIGEKIVQQAEDQSPTSFCAVRFGNVLGSAGSVVQLFHQQISDGGPVTVTHPEVRRFFMTIFEAVGLVLKAAYGDYGGLCVLDMGDQMKVLDLARHMISMAGHTPEVDIPIVFTGLRPGEKLYEELMTEDEERTRRIDEKILVAEAPPLVSTFDHDLDEIISSAVAGKEETIRRSIKRLVPSYTHATPEQAAAKDADAIEASFM
jgi:FlaA1/EpsC-like NDP-sugar epimerase